MNLRTLWNRVKSSGSRIVARMQPAAVKLSALVRTHPRQVFYAIALILVAAVGTLVLNRGLSVNWLGGVAGLSIALLRAVTPQPHG